LRSQHVKRDLEHLILSSKTEWPSDFDGNYGGMYIRQAWHCSGSYRSVTAPIGWLLPQGRESLHAVASASSIGM
jgi:catalase-peroxidase